MWYKKVFIFFSFIQSVNPVLMTSDMTRVSSDITLSNNLRWPKHGLKLFVSSLCSALGIFTAGFFITQQAFRFIKASESHCVSYLVLIVFNLLLGKLSEKRRNFFYNWSWKKYVNIKNWFSSFRRAYIRQSSVHLPPLPVPPGVPGEVRRHLQRESDQHCRPHQELSADLQVTSNWFWLVLSV